MIEPTPRTPSFLIEGSARRSTRRLSVAAVATALVFAGACSSGSDDEDATPTTSDGAVLTLPGDGNGGESTTTTASDTDTDTDTDDLPPGWIETEAQGVSIGHPDTWIEGSDERAAIVLMIDPEGATFRRNINILAQTGGGTMTLDEYVELSNEQLEPSGAVISDSSATTLDGLPAHQWRYTSVISDVSVEVLTVAAVQDGTAYLVTYTGDPSNFAELLPEVEQSFATVDLP